MRLFGKSKEEKYAEFINENKIALHTRANGLLQQMSSALLELRSDLPSKVPRGESVTVAMALMQKGPSPEENPMEHAAQVVAGDFLVAWCRKNGIGAVKRTVPAAENTHPFWIREIAVDVTVESGS